MVERLKHVPFRAALLWNQHLERPDTLKDLKDEQEIDIDIIPEPKEKLRAVLNAKSIRSKLWARIQDQIEKRAKEDGVKPPQQQ
ncbi:MAG: hypothetical protein ACLTSX_09065 [Collinsella sp.]